MKEILTLFIVSKAHFMGRTTEEALFEADRVLAGKISALTCPIATSLGFTNELVARFLSAPD